MTSFVPMHISQRFSAKATLMVAVRDHIDQLNMTQQETADVAKVGKPRISSLMNGEVERFSIDALIDMAENLGLQVSISAAPVPIQAKDVVP